MVKVYKPSKTELKNFYCMGCMKTKPLNKAKEVNGKKRCSGCIDKITKFRKDKDVHMQSNTTKSKLLKRLEKEKNERKNVQV